MVIVPHYDQLVLTSLPNDDSVSGLSGDSWKVTLKRGTQAGVGVSVSGAGAWVSLEGTMTFSLQRLESSQTYQALKREYNIGGGVSAFWKWLGISANVQANQTEIREVFNEVSTSQSMEGTLNVRMMVTGQYPNVQVDASAFIFVFQIEDSQGNTFNIFSNGDAKGDTGAQDQDNNRLPDKDNESTITI